MSFVQHEFLWFFLAVWLVYWRLPRRGQNLLLAVSSLIFYGWVTPWLVLLLLYSAALDYSCGRLIADRPGQRRRWLGLSLVGNALLLGTFKYLDFLLESVSAALVALGLGESTYTLGILLPVGISFYTFQTMSYTLDVYWGKLEPRRDFLDYLVFVSFFPQLVAGPIERAGRILPQIEAPRSLTSAAMRSGLSLALWGVSKKVVIADTLAPYVNAIYAAPDPAPLLLWTAAAGFMVQMLADFSAYSDIARGTARMLGFELMRNFRHPYLARSPTELWERWHISFSEWLRDYVFFPAYAWRWGRRWLKLPGLAVERSDLARATVITMLFSGLWHGAAWHFVLWGAFWALVHLAYQLLGPLVPLRRWRHRAVLQIPAMILLGLIAHQIFREPSVARLIQTLIRPPLSASVDEAVVALVMITFAGVGAGLLSLAMVWEEWLAPRLATTRWWLPIETTLWALAGWGIFTFARSTQADFLYFAF